MQDFSAVNLLNRHGWQVMQFSCLNHASHSMERQGEILSSTFYEWKGDHEQIDDICVIGLKL